MKHTGMGDAISETLTRFGVTIVPTKRRRRPGETHAGGVLRQIVDEHGIDVAALTIALIRGSERNAEALSSETIGALADVLAQRPDWHDRRDELAQAVDRIDLEGMRGRAVALRPWPVRLSLRASLYVRMETLVDRLNGPAAWDIAA